MFATSDQRVLRLAVYGGLLLAAILAFGVALLNPFLFDDRVVIETNHWLQWSHIARFFRSFVHDSAHSFPGYRPLLMASFTLEREWFGVVPWIPRLTNLLLHVSVSILVFEISHRIFRREPDRTRILLASAIAFFFLLHPVQSNVITLLWKRSDLLLALGLFGSFLCFWMWAEGRTSKITTLFLGYGFAFIAYFSKESAMILPAIVLLGDGTIWKSERARHTRIAALYAPLLFLSALHAWIVFHEMPLVLATYGFISDIRPPNFQFDRWTYLRTQAVAFLEYLRVVVWPTNLAVFHPIPPARSILDLRVLVGTSLVLVFVGTSYRLRRRPILVFSILWFLLLLLPSSSLVPLYLSFDEDRLYLPLLGPAILLAVGWKQLMRYGRAHAWRLPTLRVVAVAPVLLFTLFVSHSALQCRVWRNEISLWKQNVESQPTSVRAWNLLGEAYAKQGMISSALQAFDEASRLDPDYATPLIQAATLLQQTNRSEEARDRLERAFRLDHQRWQTLATWGRVNMEAGQSARAARGLVLSLQAHYRNLPAWRDLARLLEDEGDHDGALRVLRGAILLEPADPETQFQLAIFLWRTRGDREGANTILQKMLERDPQNRAIRALLREIEAS